MLRSQILWKGFLHHCSIPSTTVAMNNYKQVRMNGDIYEYFIISNVIYHDNHVKFRIYITKISTTVCDVKVYVNVSTRHISRSVPRKNRQFDTEVWLVYTNTFYSQRKHFYLLLFVLVWWIFIFCLNFMKWINHGKMPKWFQFLLQILNNFQLIKSKSFCWSHSLCIW